MANTKTYETVPAQPPSESNTREDDLRALLTELNETLRAEDLLASRERFMDLVARSMNLLDLENVQVAAELDTTTTSVYRWRSGKGSSTRAMREKVLDFMKRRVKKELAPKRVRR